MKLREYLYIDERRLNSYAEQIHPQKVLDKAPEWTASISVVGPKAIGTQKRFPRDPTVYEKIVFLEKHLEGAKPPLLAELNSEHYSPEFPSASCCFARGEMLAQRLLLTGDAGVNPTIPSLTLWIAAAPNQHPGPISNHALWRGVCLLEDFPRDDRPPINGRFSTYSAFIGLVAATLPEFIAISEEAKGLLEDLKSKSTKRGGLNEENLITLVEDSEICGRDPASLLVAIGAKRIGLPRRITSLFRIRQYSQWQTFGYPIYIAE